MTLSQYRSAIASIRPSEELIHSTIEAATACKRHRVLPPPRAAALAAALLCLAIVVGVSLIPQPGGNGMWTLPPSSSDAASSSEPGATPSQNPNPSAQSNSHAPESAAEATPPSESPSRPATSDLIQPPVSQPSSAPSPGHDINLWGLRINELPQGIASDKALYPEQDYDTVTWSYDQFTDYWGRDIRPSALPKDLYESQPEHGGEVVLSKEGQLVWDTYNFSYAENFDEQYDPLRRSVSLSVSAVGMEKEVVYQIDQPVLSDVRGVQVMFGHCAVSYGPYDPDTHQAAGTFDCYIAEFTFEGIGYQLITENLTLVEAERILLSLLEPVE